MGESREWLVHLNIDLRSWRCTNERKRGWRRWDRNRSQYSAHVSLVPRIKSDRSRQTAGFPGSPTHRSRARLIAARVGDYARGTVARSGLGNCLSIELPPASLRSPSAVPANPRTHQNHPACTTIDGIALLRTRLIG